LTTNNTKRRVVVTGMGVMTGSGKDLNTFWSNISTGKSAINRLSIINTEPLKCKIGGDIPDFDPSEFMDKKEAKKMDRFIQFAVAAARLAYTHSGLKTGDFDPERFGAVVGTGSGGIKTVEDGAHQSVEQGFHRISPFFVPMMISDMAAGQISMEYNCQGPNYALISACATGTDAIGSAFRMIQYGEIDVAFAGGTEAGITPLSIAGFASCRALSLNNDNPKEASRPFDTARDGFVMGEGCSLLIIEELEHAIKRGATIYAEIKGFGRTSDAHDLVQPRPDGYGAMRAMQKAIEESGLALSDIQYVNAHATSTPQGDRAEAKAIQNVFGEDLSKTLLVGGTKSMTGHLLGAAGSTEAVISILAMQHELIPPTINQADQDPEIPFDVIPNVARPFPGLRVTLSNSFGFGGHNASLVFQKMGSNAPQ
jgi:3-oxoacyl-[acyl-carrier-protein] synthase II